MGESQSRIGAAVPHPKGGGGVQRGKLDAEVRTLHAALLWTVAQKKSRHEEKGC
jgi:hypothetical protein